MTQSERFTVVHQPYKQRSQVYGYLFLLFFTCTLIIDRTIQMDRDAAAIYHFATTTIFAFIIYKWFRYDAKSRDYKYSSILQIGVFFRCIIRRPHLYYKE